MGCAQNPQRQVHALLARFLLYGTFTSSLERIGMKLESQVDGVAGDNFPTLIYAIEK